MAPTLWAAPPTALTTDSICRDRSAERWSYSTNYTFDAISNSGKSPRELTDEEIVRAEPGFSVQKVYAATNSVGLLQIGTAKEPGCLAFEGLSSYKGLSLVCIAQSYPLASENHSMLVSWVSGGTTNQFGRVPITDEMAPYVFSLAGVSKGAQILVQSPVKNNGRVLIDSIGFVRDAAFPGRARPLTIRVR